MFYILGGILVSAILLLVAKNKSPEDPTKIAEVVHGHIVWENMSNVSVSIPEELKTPNLRAVINVTSDVPVAIPTVEPAIPTVEPAIPKIDIDLAVLVLTGRDYKDRRQAIRRTWGNGHSNVYFVIGKHCPYRPDQRKPYVCEPKSPGMKIDAKYNQQQERLSVELSKEPDVVMVDMIDVYRHLATKLHLGYRWVVDNTSAKYVLKIDDDSFVRVDSISHWLLSRTTPPKYEMLAGKFGIGVGVTRWGKWAEKKYKPNKYPPWPSGSGHIVSRPVIEYLYQHRDTWVSYQGEDTSMGIWMDKVKADMKVTLTTSKHFITHSGDCHDKSKFVIGHAISIAKLIQCYNTMDEWDHVSAKTPSGCLRGIEMNPFELIRNHWDIIVKAVYAAAYLSPNGMTKKVSDTYSKLNLAWGGGREKCDKGHNPTSSTHPNCVPKRSIADFIRTFHATIDSMNKNGFDSRMGLVPIIPVSGTYFAINGAHRIGAAIATNNNVCVEKVNLSEHNWNENFFRRKGVPNSDLIMRDWLALDKKMIVVVLNPKTVASAKMSKVRKIVSECARTKSIVYEKDYAVNSERMRSILSVAYGQESWFKNLALERYADGFLAGPASSCKFLFIHGDQEKMKECKLRIRKLLNFAGTEFKKSCHIGDNYEQHLSMANHILDRKHGGILTEHVAKTDISNFETVIGDETVLGVIDWNGGAGTGIHKTIHLNKQGVRSLVSHLGLNEPVARQLSVTVSFESNPSTTGHLNRQQTIILAQMTLNDNSVMFLNKHVGESCLEVATELSTRYKLKPFVGTSWQFPSDLMIDSGAVMSFFGLRKRTDIDILFQNKIDKTLLGWKNNILIEAHAFDNNKLGNGRAWGQEHITPTRSVNDLFTDPQNYGYCHGIKFVSLHQLVRYKTLRGEPNKDDKDVAQIKTFLEDSGTPQKADTVKEDNCNWPAPLYPETKKRPIASLSVVQKWLVKHRSTVVAYLQSGVLLGLYRDGTAIMNDNDIDIRFGVMGNNAKIRKQLLALKRHDSKLSFNDMRRWGDFSNYISKNNISDQLLTELSERLCLAARSPIQTLNNARQDLEGEYGPFWFVKVPLHGMHVNKWKSWTNSVGWRNAMSIISKMDVNNDSTISTDELDAYVRMDGIDEKEYKNQISSVDKCRAAKALSWMINYDMAPYQISIPSGQEGWPDFPEFKFPECGV